MSPSNPQHPDTIIIEQVSRPSRIGENVPLLPRTVESVLLPLLRSASLDPENWHTIPSYVLAIRFIASVAPARATGFEIRHVSAADSSQRYRYDYPLDTLTCWSHDQLEHPNLSVPSQLPTHPEALARLITTVLRTRPETLGPIAAVHTSVPETRHLVPSSPPNHGPLSYGFANVIRYISTNWFGGQETNWRLRYRILCAFLGSFTFFAMQALVILRYEHLLRNPSADQSTFQSAQFEDQFFVGPLGIGLLMIPLSIIFAFISAYVDRHHRPGRLYLGGFLLPYLPWSLIVFVTAAMSSS